jgi:hypothetical protein
MPRGHKNAHLQPRRPKMTKALGTLLVAAGALLAALPIAAQAALPDGRVHEQVSPVDKFGGDAGATRGSWGYAHATADGSGVLYKSGGAIGEPVRGLQEYSVSRRGGGGWATVSALPAGSQDRLSTIGHDPRTLLPSSDLTKLVFSSSGSYIPDENPDLGNNEALALYLAHADGTIDWLTRPLIANPDPAPGHIQYTGLFQPVGAAPDLSTVYFWSQPTLLPQDDARASSGLGGWGLYEYSDGGLKPAGTLPDGTEDPGGAAPAATNSGSRTINNFITPEMSANQVSRDGSTLFFVSPDPGPNPDIGPVTQLYVRRDGHSTLVSHAPDGTPTPSGAKPVRQLNSVPDGFPQQFAYASPDGGVAIFQSVDALTPDAPSNSAIKSYRYDVATDTVSYLPGVGNNGPDFFGSTVVAASDDGRRFLFSDGGIKLWDHGVIKTLAPSDGAQLAPARATGPGSVFVFSTNASIGGANSGGFTQIYRYDVAEDKTTCLSCPPAGVVPSAEATLAIERITGDGPPPHNGNLAAPRGISADGQRVFFQSPDPLVDEDINRAADYLGRPLGIDVYEWTPAGVSLISGGRSQLPSLVMDNSASGDDVFFTTAEGLADDDTDGAYDVYDARVGGGFKKPAVVAPCTGDGCQGGVTGPPPLGDPGSSVFSGAGDERERVPAPSARLALGTRKFAKGALAVTVRIARPGRVKVSGSGLQTTTHTYRKSGRFQIKVSVSEGGKRTLRIKHRLKLRVRVDFAPKSGAASSVKFVLNAKA